MLRSRRWITRHIYFFTTELGILGGAIATSRNLRKKPSASGISRTGANMQMSNNSREDILSAIRNNLPKQKVQHPQVPAFQRPAGPLKAAFEEHLKKAGGAAHNLGSPAEAEAKLMGLHPGAMVICSAVPEIAGTHRVQSV